MIRFLVIWEEVPETTKVYSIVAQTPVERAHLERCAGVYVGGTNNSSEQEASLAWLSERLTKLYPDERLLLDSKNGKFMATALSEHRIILTGFLL